MSRRTLALVCFVLALACNLAYHSRRPDVEYVALQQQKLASPQFSNISAPILTPASDRRGEDQTFLTIPEWYLVFSSAEYADVMSQRSPDAFPYFAHIGQFWSMYGASWKQTRQRYEFNLGYHVMVMVIGISTTVEYTCKAAYETTIGALSGLASGRCAEDNVAAVAAQDYQRFIRIYPWYLFDFMKPLAAVWQQPLTGIRSIERRYFLTSEYLVKGAYGALLTLATSAIYGAAGDVTTCVLDGDDKPVTLPRYEAFMRSADSIARAGRSFIEIAGNRGEIAVSAIAPRPLQPAPASGRILIEQPIITRVPHTRMVFTVPVSSLTAALDTMRAKGWELEHVYDY